jgi:ribosomal protein L29
MKKTDKIDYRNKEISFLIKEAGKLRLQALRLKAELLVGKKKDTSETKKIRKNIARILGIIAEKQRKEQL